MTRHFARYCHAPSAAQVKLSRARREARLFEVTSGSTYLIELSSLAKEKRQRPLEVKINNMQILFAVQAEVTSVLVFEGE